MWSDEARAASIAARKGNAQANGVAHQAGVGQVGQKTVSERVLDVIRSNPNGFSVTPKGDQPTKGYMVSVPGRSRILASNDLKGPAAQEIIEDYARRNSDILKQAGAHIGGWEDSKTSKVHLDVSHNISRASHAIRAGRERNQIKIWDVKRKREIDTGGTGDHG